MKKIFLIILSFSLTACGRNDDNNATTPTTENSNPVGINTEKIVTEVLRIPYQNGNKTINIYGEITAPEGYQNQPLPTIILSPGFGNNLNFIANQYAERLAKLGYVTYSFEFYGGNHGSRSGGQMTEMSPFTEAEDLTAVLDNLREKPFVDKNNIFLLGFSQGGVVSTITATESKEKVKGLILMNAALVLFDDARALFKSVDEIPEYVDFRGNRLGRIYFERSLSYDIFQTMPNFDKEVLIIHGEQDEVVPVSYAERAKNTFPKAELNIISGGRHIFSASQNNTLFPFIQNYLARNIQ